MFRKLCGVLVWAMLLALGGSASPNELKQIGPEKFYGPKSTKKYIDVGRNPRGVDKGDGKEKIFIDSWAEAIDYMVTPSFENDLRRLKVAVPAPCLGWYDKLVVEAKDLVHDAHAHNVFLSGHPCKYCKQGCVARDRVSKRVRKEQLRRGTIFLGVTHGNGKVAKGLEFLGEDGHTYYAYNLHASALIREFEVGGKRRYLYARTIFSLIAHCGNVGLQRIRTAELELDRVVTVTPVPEISDVPPDIYLGIQNRNDLLNYNDLSNQVINNNRNIATAIGQGGNATVYIPQPERRYGYAPSGLPQRDVFSYNAGSVGVQPVPKFNAKMFQQQFQQQQQSQWQALQNAIENNNWVEVQQILENLLNIPISIDA